MRKCCKCKEEKSLEEFAWKHKKKGVKHSNCRECQKEYQKEHYSKNKKYYYEKNRKNSLKSREWFHKYLEDKSCEICGETERCTFDFHHLDPSEKDYNVAELAGQTFGIETLQKEINKCVLLCANCHRKVHAGVIQV